MTKVIIQQRSKLNSQIKEIDIEFDVGPNVQVHISILMSLVSRNKRS